MPLQLAAVRMGPRWVLRPERTWWLYSHTASAMMIGVSGWMSAKTSMPMRWFQMKPWLHLGVVLVAAAHGPADLGEHVGDLLLEHLLGRPAHDVGGVAQVAAGHKDDLVRLGRRRLSDGRDLVFGSHLLSSPFESGSFGHDAPLWER